METPHCFDKLGSVKAGTTFAELLILAQVVKEFTTVLEVHDEVELGRRLERIVQLHYERTVNFLEDVPLCLRLDEQITLRYYILP